MPCRAFTRQLAAAVARLTTGVIAEHSVRKYEWEAIAGLIAAVAEADALAGKAKLLSFWGEPFMAAHHHRRVPGYIIHVREHSELIGRLREVERASRLV